MPPTNRRHRNQRTLPHGIPESPPALAPTADEFPGVPLGCLGIQLGIYMNI